MSMKEVTKNRIDNVYDAIETTRLIATQASFLTVELGDRLGIVNEEDEETPHATLVKRLNHAFFSLTENISFIDKELDRIFHELEANGD